MFWNTIFIYRQSECYYLQLFTSIYLKKNILESIPNVLPTWWRYLEFSESPPGPDKRFFSFHTWQARFEGQNFPPKKSFAKWNATTMWYCWWKTSCTTWDVKNPVSNGINYLSAGAGFPPPTVGLGLPKKISFVAVFFWWLHMIIWWFMTHRLDKEFCNHDPGSHIVF